MVSWVVTCRSTLRRSRKSHPLYVLTPSPRAAVQSRRSDVWAFRRADVPKSFPFNPFADPHPLTPVASILLRKHGGEGAPFPQPSDVQTFGPSDVFPTYPLSFQILAQSFALSKNSTLLFSSVSALFHKNHPGWGEGSSFLRPSDVPTFRHSNDPPVPLRRTPLGATIGNGTDFAASWETYRPRAVSKMIERTSGTARSWFPLQVVPVVQRSKAGFRVCTCKP
jgi:hypothetical protein